MGSVLATSRNLRSIVTRRSVLPPPASHEDPGWERSWGYLFEIYGPAMVRYVRSILTTVRGRAPEASEPEDIVQDYLARSLAKGWLSRDVGGIRCFRAYLQTQLRRFTFNHIEHELARKRGPPRGSIRQGPEDLRSAEPDPSSVDLDRGWVESAVSWALDALREGNADYHEIIVDLLHTHGAGSIDLGPRMRRTPQQMVHLRHRARKRFAVLFHDCLRESVRDDEAFEGLCERLAAYLP